MKDIDKAIVQVCDNLEKWLFKMEFCRKAGFSPYNDLYWDLAEQAYAQRYFENFPASNISLKKF